MSLGKQISTYRKNLGISQEELGTRLGVSRQAVSKWETNAATPDMENLLALAREFDVSVTELTQTPDRSEEPPPAPGKRCFRPLPCGILGVAPVIVLALTFIMNLPDTDTAEKKEASLSSQTPIQSEITKPTPYPSSDFALLWANAEGYEEFLELGVQDGFFPFGTSLELTAPEEVLDTDFSTMKYHRAVCGAITVEYNHIEEDLDPESPEREGIICLSTIAKSVHTPRGIHVGSSKGDVISAYGDELVYCLKEEYGYTLVQHDYYYAYNPESAFSNSLCIFMRDGVVVGLRLEDMGDWGNDAFRPDNILRFPVVNGEPDFSQRVEPEREDVSDTQKVYIAFNQLVTNKNLSAEELYAYRRDVFANLPNMNWTEFGLCGSKGMEDDTRFALMAWLNNQESYSSSEILWLQMGCTARGLDGAYSERYAAVLSSAFFYDPILFAKTLAADSVPADTRSHVISSTAFDAEWYPTQLAEATTILEAALSNGTFTELEAGWVELLLLYLSTPIEECVELPKSPSEME